MVLLPDPAGPSMAMTNLRDGFISRECPARNDRACLPPWISADAAGLGADRVVGETLRTLAWISARAPPAVAAPAAMSLAAALVRRHGQSSARGRPAMR